MSFNTPVLFIVFNRPETTEQVFEAIKKVQPKQLFVAADGPRTHKEGEKEKCEEVRRIATAVDWACEVKTLFRQENMGCGMAVSSGINWFFEYVEQGIILEDDCLPDSTFFTFCDEMLRKYKYDSRVMHVSGNNFQLGNKIGSGDYYYSRYSHIWGWATWRESWGHYDFNINKWPSFQNDGLKRIFKDEIQINFWKNIFNTVYEKEIDTWDYQWLHAIWVNESLCVLPNVNLVVNIGFGESATHTKHSNSIIENVQMESIKSFKNPGMYNDVADNYSFYNLFSPYERSHIIQKLIQSIRVKGSIMLKKMIS